MANEKVKVEANTFLKVIFVFEVALTRNGPWGLGGKQVPVKGII